MAGIGFENPTYARSKVEASERKTSEEGPRPQDSLQKKWTEKWGRVTLFLLLLRNNMTDISIARTAFYATVSPQNLFNVLQTDALRNCRLSQAKPMLLLHCSSK